MRKEGVFSHITTDHYHYFEVGGENYPLIFDSWEFIRGQERDTLVPNLGKKEEREHYGQYHTQYELNRQSFKDESDYPSPKTFSQAAKFIDQFHDEDNWFLFVDSSDPHEPFDVPDDFEEDYGDTYDDKLFYWPKYESTENMPEHALEHIRKQYAKTLTMGDKWLGKLLDKMDEHQLWEDTLVILTADHGFMLGEHTLMGKNYVPAYNEIYHIPLLIHQPGQKENRRINALTQNIDLFPTLLEFFGGNVSSCPDKLHGKSLIPLLEGEVDKLRDTAIYGLFGKQVNITDGKYTYFRSAIREDNSPINLYTGLPTTINHYWDRDHIKDISKIETGRFLKWTEYPVFKISGSNSNLSNDSHRFDIRFEIQANNMLFDIEKDYAQRNNICGGPEEERMCSLLKQALIDHDSPDDQFIRLGL